MRLSGIIPIDGIGVAGAKIPSEELLVSTPVVIAPTKSSSPPRFKSNTFRLEPPARLAS